MNIILPCTMKTTVTSDSSRLKRGLLLLLFSSVLVLVYMDMFVYNVFVPHIPKIISKTFTFESAPHPPYIQDTSLSSHYNVTYNNNNNNNNNNITKEKGTSYKILYASHNDVIKKPGPPHKIVLTPNAITTKASMANNKTDETKTKTEVVDYYNSNSPDFKAALRRLGYETAESHSFESPYLITPHTYDDQGYNISKPPGKRQVKIISVYNSPKWFKTASLVTYNRDFKKCLYSECEFDVLGKKKATADFLLFFFNSLRGPPKRRPGQIWGFCSWESPQHYGYSKPHYPLWKDQINVAVSYRTDAELFMPNNYVAWRDSSTLLTYQDYVNIAQKKTKTAAWWVSNCGTHSKRELYVKEMQKYIDVDVYGKCGPLKCSKKNIDECETMLTTTYKFYLSFENSLCLDYVSEKFWRMFAYRTHVVPVGRSGFDYNKYIPGNFVVDANNFKTAKDLALYLKALGEDVPRYAKHLQEKDKLVSLNRKVDWCDVCQRLHTAPGLGKTRVKDIRAWSHDKSCRGPTDIK